MYKEKNMLKKLACLLILTLAVGCAAKSHSASPEDVLEEIAASRWVIDVDASLKTDSDAREEIERIGKDRFVAKYGQFGFSLDLRKRELIWFDTDEAVPFTVIPENDEDAAERLNGARQVRMSLDGGKDAIILLRYADAGKLLLFARDGKDELMGVFAPLEK